MVFSLIISPLFATASLQPEKAYHATEKTLRAISPQGELLRLQAGNARFIHNKPQQRDLLHQAKLSSLQGQFPAAIILSCMDSRTSSEIILDQGLGDIFSLRVAGNIVDVDQIASMEYATKVIGTKLIVVMGHTQCGAVKGACEKVELGNLSQLLNKIQPAVAKVKKASQASLDCKNNDTIDKIAKENVLEMMQQVREKSPIIQDLLKQKKILIVGAMQDLYSGKIVFFNEQGQSLMFLHD
ncbi:MAG: carbonic anhydrase [Gammaproteobacteria bacterium]|nr:carbonic anhydrase [Gammaproteobacteria bacterium]